MKRIHTTLPFPLPPTAFNLPWWVIFTKRAFRMQWTLKRISTNRDRIFFCKRLAWLTFTSQLQIEITMSSSTKGDSDILYIISYFSQFPIQIERHNETLLTLNLDPCCCCTVVNFLYFKRKTYFDVQNDKEKVPCLAEYITLQNIKGGYSWEQFS